MERMELRILVVIFGTPKPPKSWGESFQESVDVQRHIPQNGQEETLFLRGQLCNMRSATENAF